MNALQAAEKHLFTHYNAHYNPFIYNVAKTRKVKFLSDMMSSKCYYLRSVVSLTGNEELNAIAEFYAVDVSCVIKNCNEIALKSLEPQVIL